MALNASPHRRDVKGWRLQGARRQPGRSRSWVGGEDLRQTAGCSGAAPPAGQLGQAIRVGWRGPGARSRQDAMRSKSMTYARKVHHQAAAVSSVTNRSRRRTEDTQGGQVKARRGPCHRDAAVRAGHDGEHLRLRRCAHGTFLPGASLSIALGGRPAISRSSPPCYPQPPSANHRPSLRRGRCVSCADKPPDRPLHAMEGEIPKRQGTADSRGASVILPL